MARQARGAGVSKAITWGDCLCRCFIVVQSPSRHLWLFSMVTFAVEDESFLLGGTSLSLIHSSRLHCQISSVSRRVTEHQYQQAMHRCGVGWVGGEGGGDHVHRIIGGTLLHTTIQTQACMYRFSEGVIYPILASTDQCSETCFDWC